MVEHLPTCACTRPWIQSLATHTRTREKFLLCGDLVNMKISYYSCVHDDTVENTASTQSIVPKLQKIMYGVIV